MMRLRILLPTEIVCDQPVSKVLACGESGSFCLLPRHIDFVTLLVPGILTFVDAEEHERFVAHSAGTLVKTASLVRVSAEHAVAGDRLEELEDIVRQRFNRIDEISRAATTAVARLEADFVRRYLELEGRLNVGKNA